MNFSLKGIPKAELHVHLEGFIGPRFLYGLIKKHKIISQVNSLADARRLYDYPGFDGFLKAFTFAVDCMRSPEDYKTLAEYAVTSLIKQNVEYAELIFSPCIPVLRQKLDYFKALDAVLEGCETGGRQKTGDRKQGVEINIIIDLVRNIGPDLAMKMLDLAIKSKNRRVVAITIGGDERRFPARLFVKHFRKAGDAGLKLTAHAGEDAGPQSIWDALLKLKVDRIGHGIAAVKDRRLMEYLRDKRIPLEVCPTSNIRTGLVKTVEKHPVRRLFDAGLTVTVNSDDPEFFRTNINKEYRLLAENLDFTGPELRRIAENAVKAAFSPKKLLKK
ncbi:MAG: adenosine deaminase [Planctomycetes bacterium]|nr:adenosine deaminase [Planctomycetota bacterium]